VSYLVITFFNEPVPINGEVDCGRPSFQPQGSRVNANPWELPLRLPEENGNAS
jgi:hypothetical protein